MSLSTEVQAKIESRVSALKFWNILFSVITQCWNETYLTLALWWYFWWLRVCIPSLHCQLWDAFGGKAAARDWPLGFCIHLQFLQTWCTGHSAIKRPNCQVQFLNVHHPQPALHIKDIHWTQFRCILCLSVTGTGPKYILFSNNYFKDQTS